MSNLKAALALALLLFAPPMAAASPAGNATCIRDPEIDHTERPNDFTILFFMRDRHVWKNTLPSRCFGLHNEPDGFTYQPTDPATEELCSNQVTIKLNNFGSFCLLGAFTQVK